MLTNICSVEYLGAVSLALRKYAFSSDFLKIVIKNPPPNPILWLWTAPLQANAEIAASTAVPPSFKTSLMKYDGSIYYQWNYYFIKIYIMESHIRLEFPLHSNFQGYFKFKILYKKQNNYALFNRIGKNVKAIKCYALAIKYMRAKLELSIK